MDIKAAFKSYLQGKDGAKSAYESELKVSGQMVEGVEADGGVLVPEVWANGFIERRDIASTLRKAGVTVYPNAGGKIFHVPYLSDNTAALAKVLEEGTIPTEKPTFGEAEMVPYKYPIIYIGSDELVEDTNQNLDEILRNYFMRRVANTENALFATGTGSGQPQGIFVGATVGHTAAGTTAITYADMLGLYASLAEEYRQNAVWFISSAANILLLQLTQGNANVMQLGPDGNFMLLGRPVYVLSGPAVAAGTKPVVFGDPAAYAIADWTARPNVKFLGERYADTGQVAWRMQVRIDGRVIDPQGLKSLQMAAS
jgi:HK97 family phage major capsid protein